MGHRRMPLKAYKVTLLAWLKQVAARYGARDIQTEARQLLSLCIDSRLEVPKPAKGVKGTGWVCVVSV